MLDIRFSSALQAMLYLAIAAERDEPTTSSAQLAEALGTNPSLVRKLLVPLGAGGLIVSTKGRTGGTRLSRPAERITLAEIYRCAVGEKPLWACRPESEHVCLDTGNAARYFAELTAETERAVLESLEHRTLAGAVAEMRRLDREPATT
ncbi:MULTISPECIES: Rrf2 family transcriptional regulator [unclassified Pseudonocardia]|uniref:RrF2 family transcriptional regulator n=1 Tax=unclassified Pseudonocardia TaxID=2619320 RepID=UPI0002F5E894|nr:MULTISPECIES: Rrf2 family transcriptional regulator [unclassified Pseudonocardia]ALE73315.1 Rrf2 family transcriptional regulator [Pseudonocardia sp. EC080625-04]ALL76654.1 Rrf2 family transcriptional regulator [Pseudonocardia sp. EC080610-09]ALL83682.1 Rrf2 family transcriptional regulator [Pseudonocardia sp. EC080619-01]OLM18968.1 Rrf2 family transcriptional regulator, group III [Pseudonocardia sp. Ae707_Ps1]